MNDVLPDRAAYWDLIEASLREVLSAYGYRELRLPILERTELFQRSIGEVTDIVEKEMYTFVDRNGESLSLRPEGTAGCVRCGIEHGLFRHQVQRLWYVGPMFRHERPQLGRYRQFHQAGVEAFGLAGPDVDAEMVLMTARLWRRLGVQDALELQLNSLGNSAARAAYRERLVAHFNAHRESLDEDSQRRLDSNPLRILDSKHPQMQALIEAAPRLLDHIDADSRAHFEAMRAVLDGAGIDYRINTRLVRGLDYYEKTVFEWVSDRLGAQGTVCAGGRYDGLVQQLGGQPTAAVGFAIGIERLVALAEALGAAAPARTGVHAYLVLLGEAAAARGLLLAEHLREAVPGLRLETHCGGGGIKGQLKRADRHGATVALLLGEEELSRGVLGIKFLREDRPQVTLEEPHLLALLQALVAQDTQPSAAALQ